MRVAWATNDDAGTLYSRRTAADFEEQFSQELVVPSRSLKIAYTPPEAAAGELKVPLGYTFRKA